MGGVVGSWADWLRGSVASQSIVLDVLILLRWHVQTVTVNDGAWSCCVLKDQSFCSHNEALSMQEDQEVGCFHPGFFCLLSARRWHGKYWQLCSCDELALTAHSELRMRGLCTTSQNHDRLREPCKHRFPYLHAAVSQSLIAQLLQSPLQVGGVKRRSIGWPREEQHHQGQKSPLAQGAAAQQELHRFFPQERLPVDSREVRVTGASRRLPCLPLFLLWMLLRFSGWNVEVAEAHFACFAQGYTFFGAVLPMRRSCSLRARFKFKAECSSVRPSRARLSQWVMLHGVKITMTSLLFGCCVHVWTRTPRRLRQSGRPYSIVIVNHVLPHACKHLKRILFSRSAGPELGPDCCFHGALFFLCCCWFVSWSCATFGETGRWMYSKTKNIKNNDMHTRYSAKTWSRNRRHRGSENQTKKINWPQMEIEPSDSEGSLLIVLDALNHWANPTPKKPPPWGVILIAGVCDSLSHFNSSLLISQFKKTWTLGNTSSSIES